MLTGTGVPVPDPARAGAGTLVDLDDVRVQVDAGRGTVLRLAGSMTTLTSIDAVLLTHHHSDHLVGLADLVLSRWVAGADVLVHEVRLRSFAEATVGTHYQAIAAYHADAVDLGASAERAGVGRLALTHFIPPPVGGYQPFIDEVRAGASPVSWWPVTTSPP